MSIRTADTETEQNGRPRICSPTGWCVSDTREPPNTEDGESDELSSSGIQNCNKDSQHNECMDFISDREPTSAELSWEDDGACSDDLDIILETGAPAVPRTELQTHIRNVIICRKENSSVSSGTDGGNSDIGDLADFSSDEEEPHVEQFPGCRIPGCQCEGHIEYMEWDSDDMTDSEDSEWEDPEERANRLWVEQYNYDLIEGMTLMTYTPPPRKNRRRTRLNVHRKYRNRTVVLVIWGSKRKKNHPSWNRRCSRGRMPMRISPRVGITKITRDTRRRPEVIRTFPTGRIQNFSTDWSRSR